MSILSNSPHNVYGRETYAWRKAHHICTKCGQNDAVAGQTRCFSCIAKNKHTCTTEELFTIARRAKKLYELRVAFGVCPKCGKRDTEPPYKMCAVCRAKERRRSEKQRRKAGIFPRDSYSDMCVTCGKKPPIEGKKICKECHEKALHNLSKANAANAANKQNHIWVNDNRIVFNNYRTEARQ